MNFEEKMNKVVLRKEEVEKLLSNNNLSSKELTKLSKELSELIPISEEILKIYGLNREIEEVQFLIDDPENNEEMIDLANKEQDLLVQQLNLSKDNLKKLMLPKDEDDDKNVILEVRAGTGGDEAALFASDLFGMYQKFSSRLGWKFEVMQISEIGIGGYKEATANISGNNVFAKLKFESGVHRVQRIPETETGGRIHTSAATVAVLPEVQELDVEVKESDLKIDVFRASGPGGQSVNTTDSAVRITHLPTGLVVSQQDEKSQHKNKSKAMKILRARLYDLEKLKEQEKRAKSRKNQVGSGDRSERIRTYNFPQGRVTDHRINLTLYKLEKILSGENLIEFFDALSYEDQASKLTEGH